MSWTNFHQPTTSSIPVVSFPKDSELSTPEVKELLQYRLENSASLAEIHQLAGTLLTKQEWGALQDACTFAQSRIKNLDVARRKRQKRRGVITAIKAKATTTYHEKRCLEWEEEIFNGLPNTITLTLSELEEFKYKFAELMIYGALKRKSVALATEYRTHSNRLLDDKLFDNPVIEVIENAVVFISSAENLMRLCRVIDSQGSPQLAIPVLKAAYQLQVQVREKLLERSKLQARIQLLEKERGFLVRIKKDLTPAKLTELAKVKEQLQEFEMPFTGNCNALDINALEQQALQITLMMLACAVNVKKNLVTKRGELLRKAAVLTKAEQEIIQDPSVVGRTIERIVSWAFEDRIQDPAHMMQVVKNAEFENQLDYAYSCSEKIRAQVLALKAKHKSRMDTRNINSLRQKQTELLDKWKLLDEEDAKTLYDLEFQEIIDSHNSPAYENPSFSLGEPFKKWDTLESQSLTWIIDCIYAEKQDLEEKQANPRKYPTFRQLSASELAKKRADYAARVLRVIDDLEAPLLLFQLAKHVQTKRDSDTVFKIGNKCQGIIQNIDQLRTLRLPIQTEINKLTGEKDDLIKRNRDVPPQTIKKIEELTAKINELPAWPEYGVLTNPHQYDELNLDIVRVMTSAILDNKTALEEDIARMFKENAPEDIDYQKIERDRNAIQVKIQELTKQCLTQFSDPVYLLRFAKDMKNRRESEVVLEVIAKCLSIIEEINAKRKVRKPLQVELNALEREKADPKKKLTAEQEAQLKTLKEQLEALPVWPHYAEVMDDNQYSKTVYHCIHLVLNSVLDKREELEASVARQIYENKRAVDEQKVAEDRKQKEEQIQQALETCFHHINTPDDLKDLAASMSDRKEAEVLLKVAKHAFQCIDNCLTVKREGNDLTNKITILREEEASLRALKKTLAPEHAKELEALKAARKRLAEEAGWKKKDTTTTISTLDAIRDSIALQVFTTTFDTKKRLANQIESNRDLTKERKAHFNELSANCVKESLKLLKLVENPNTLNTIVNDLNNRKEYALAGQVAEECFNRVGKLVKERDEYAEQTRDRFLFLEEEKTLYKVHHRLPEEKKAILRRLEFEHRKYQQNPSYYQTSFNMEEFVFQLSCLLVSVTLSHQQSVQHQEMAVEQDKNNEIKRVVELCLQHIKRVPTLIRFAEVLRNRTQHGMVVIIGKHAEQKIFEQKQEYEEREKLKAEFERLDNLRLTYLFKKEESAATEEVGKKLEETQNLLAKLPKIDDLQAQIDARNKELLSIIDMVIAAAKIEDLEEELRDQTILAFKTDTTTERWDTIRQIVPEEEWLTIKEELVVYVIQQDTNTTEKIELLLKDGLYKHVLDVFPKPTGVTTEMDLLLRVYRAVEYSEPELLERLLPIVGSFMKHYFAKQDYDLVDPILERVQKRFPSIIIKLYQRACEMVMLNIMPSQYPKFVKMLTKVKERMEEINRHDDWNEFFAEFKKKHKGKSKLIQMVSLIGDSVWDLEAIMRPPPKKRAKTEKVKSPSAPKTKTGTGGTESTDDLEEPKRKKPAPKKRAPKKKAATKQ